MLSRKLRIDEKIVVSGKGHLHEPAAILRHDDEAEPLVGDLLGGPPEIVNRLNPAGGLCLRIVLCGSCAGTNSAGEAAEEDESG